VRNAIYLALTPILLFVGWAFLSSAFVESAGPSGGVGGVLVAVDGLLMIPMGVAVGWRYRVQRHRLDRGGNRQLNCALHRIAVTQARVHPPARAYLERKQTEGKSRREAIRCLKRQLARVIFNTLKTSPALT
jgi:hypothetical protein